MGRGPTGFLTPIQKYEIFLQLVRGEMTIADAAAAAGVDRCMARIYSALLLLPWVIFGGVGRQGLVAHRPQITSPSSPSPSTTPHPNKTRITRSAPNEPRHELRKSRLC